MEGNNYYWGYWENEAAWAIASYYFNPIAPIFLYDALVVRWQNGLLPYWNSVGSGGIGPEGPAEYSCELFRDIVMGYQTFKSMGLDLLNQNSFATSWYMQAIAYIIYSTSPKPNSQTNSYTTFPFSDDSDSWGFPVWARGGYQGGMDTNDWGDFMVLMVEPYLNKPMGQYTQQWINMVNPTNSPWVIGTATSGFVSSFTNLPLDYYASGPQFLITRNSWASNAVVVFLQLGCNIDHCSHTHQDVGTFQICMGSESLALEHTGYSTTFADGTQDGWPTAHNSIVFNQQGCQLGNPNVMGIPQTISVQSSPNYSYSAVNLTPSYFYTNQNVPASYVLREFLFIKPLNTLVVVDRLQSSSSGIVQQFCLHTMGVPTTTSNTNVNFASGNYELFMTTLPTVSGNYYTVTNEGDADLSSQIQNFYAPVYRLQDNISGVMNTVFVHSITMGGVGTNPVTTTISGINSPNQEAGSGTWTINFTSANSGNATLVLNQGVFSLGGSFGYTSSGVPLLSPLSIGIQNIDVTTNGVFWAPFNFTSGNIFYNPFTHLIGYDQGPISHLLGYNILY
jgi:hypothetical protein